MQTDIKVYANIVHDCPMGIALGCEKGGTLDNVKVYNNLCYNNIWNMSVNIWGNPAGKIQNIYIYNNTSYNRAKTAVPLQGGMYLNNKYSLGSNIVVVNNIYAAVNGLSNYTPIYTSIDLNTKGYVVSCNLFPKNIR
jgi:hypothetical protein